MKLVTTKLVEIAEINPRFRNGIEASDEKAAFVPMSAVSAESASVEVLETRDLSTVINGFTYFQDGDILVAKITPCFENCKIAHARIAQRHGFGSTEFHVVRPMVSKLDARYLLHFLRQPRIRMEGERRMTGSAGQRRVPKHFLEGLEIPLPQLQDQQRIAGILDKADALRARRRNTIAKLDTLAQALFLDLFGDPRTNPNGWPLRPLVDLGRVVTGSTPPTANAGMFGGSIPFVTPGDLESNQLAKRTLTEAGAVESRIVRAGATLVCCIGATIGKMGKATQRSAFNQQINAVEWSPEVDDNFGYSTLRFFKQHIATAGASTTLPILKKSSFQQIEIPVPSIELQAQFARIATAIERLLRKQREAQTKMSTLFASLQHRAFKGEL